MAKAGSIKARLAAGEVMLGTVVTTPSPALVEALAIAGVDWLWLDMEHLPSGSRLAWCYGDLGIASALFFASKATSNKEWEEKAIEILKYSTKRLDLTENSVSDAALCHGTAGIAHIYGRIYNYTKIIDFQHSAEYWFNEALKMAKFFHGIAGYLSPNSDTNSNYVKQTGFLEGAAGIGLAMLAAVSDSEPSWDEALLLSV